MDSIKLELENSRINFKGTEFNIKYDDFIKYYDFYKNSGYVIYVTDTVNSPDVLLETNRYKIKKLDRDDYYYLIDNKKDTSVCITEKTPTEIRPETSIEFLLDSKNSIIINGLALNNFEYSFEVDNNNK